MTELRQALQEEKMQQMRKRIQSSMREIESCLSQLDDLDDKAKVRKKSGGWILWSFFSTFPAFMITNTFDMFFSPLQRNE
jgi:hypothetical protein